MKYMAYCYYAEKQPCHAFPALRGEIQEIYEELVDKPTLGRHFFKVLNGRIEKVQICLAE